MPLLPSTQDKYLLCFLKIKPSIKCALFSLTLTCATTTEISSGLPPLYDKPLLLAFCANGESMVLMHEYNYLLILGILFGYRSDDLRKFVYIFNRTKFINFIQFFNNYFLIYIIPKSKLLR